jgi:hypothetical protein
MGGELHADLFGELLERIALWQTTGASAAQSAIAGIPIQIAIFSTEPIRIEHRIASDHVLEHVQQADATVDFLDRFPRRGTFAIEFPVPRPILLGLQVTLLHQTGRLQQVRNSIQVNTATRRRRARDRRIQFVAPLGARVGISMPQEVIKAFPNGVIEGTQTFKITSWNNGESHACLL